MADQNGAQCINGYLVLSADRFKIFSTFYFSTLIISFPNAPIFPSGKVQQPATSNISINTVFHILLNYCIHIMGIGLRCIFSHPCTDDQLIRLKLFQNSAVFQHLLISQTCSLFPILPKECDNVVKMMPCKKQ